jgi:hypothetical protein
MVASSATATKTQSLLPHRSSASMLNLACSRATLLARTLIAGLVRPGQLGEGEGSGCGERRGTGGRVRVKVSPSHVPTRRSGPVHHVPRRRWTPGKCSKS